MENPTPLRDRLGARIQEKLTHIGHRADFYLADYRMAGSQIATLAIGYDPGVGKPSADDVRRFMIKYFDGRVEPHMASCTLHPEYKAVRINGSISRSSRDHSDIEKMMHLGGNRYLEAATEEIWEVEENDGVPALYRNAEEDLETILKQRRARQSYAKRIRLSSFTDPGHLMSTPGVQVVFFDDRGQEKVARVMSEPDEQGYIKVRITGHKSDTDIHQNQIAEMLTTAELDETTKKQLKDYFSEAYGDDGYAQDLVEAKVVVGTKTDLMGFLTEANIMDSYGARAFADRLRVNRGKVLATGPGDIILARYHGNGYEWQVDMDAAEKALG